MDAALPSTKPYLVRALYEWCSDHGFTPYVTVDVDSHTVVPRELVRDGQITLNVSMEATGKLNISNEALQCTARFGGVARELWVPMGRIVAIFARENGAGMAFEPEAMAVEGESVASAEEAAAPSLSPVVSAVPDGECPSADGGQGGGAEKKRPTLQRVK